MIDYQHKSHTLHRSSSQPSEMHLQHVNSDIVFTFECSNRAISFGNKDNPLHPLLFFICLSACSALYFSPPYHFSSQGQH